MRKLKALTNLPSDAVYDEINSPVGKLAIIASSEGLHAVLWEIYRKNLEWESITKGLSKAKNNKIIKNTEQQLCEYFQGKRKTFDLPLVLRGTKFQVQAWKQLLKIPYSKTITYGQQAQRIGNKNKARAVGMANGLNQISIIVPCHRVIGSNGKLVGFGGGLDNKAYLLNLEKTHVK